MLPVNFSPEFPSGVLDVAIWTRIVLDLYVENSSRGAFSRGRTHKLRVIELRHFKKYSPFEHEYIVTEIRIEGSYHYLKFDRNSKYSASTRTAGKHALITTDLFNVAAAVLSFAPSYRLLAIDTVTPLDSWPNLQGKSTEAFRLVNQIKFFDDSPTLLDLVLISGIIHDHSTEYGVFKRQCFWYAGILSRTLRKVALEAQCRGQRFEEVQDGAAGTWKRLRVVQDFSEQVALIWNVYRAKKASLLSQISDADIGWRLMMRTAGGYPEQKRVDKEGLK